MEEAEESEDDSLEGIRSDYNPKYQWLRQGNKLHLMLMNVDFDQKSLRCITRPSKPTAKVVIQGYRIEKNEQPTGYYAMFYGSRPSYRYIPFTTVLTLPDVPIDFKKAPRATYYDDQSVMDITYTLKEEEEKPRVVRGHKRASPQPMSMPSREEEPATHRGESVLSGTCRWIRRRDEDIATRAMRTTIRTARAATTALRTIATRTIRTVNSGVEAIRSIRTLAMDCGGLFVKKQENPDRDGEARDPSPS